MDIAKLIEASKSAVTKMKIVKPIPKQVKKKIVLRSEIERYKRLSNQLKKE